MIKRQHRKNLFFSLAVLAGLFAGLHFAAPAMAGEDQRQQAGVAAAVHGDVQIAALTGQVGRQIKSGAPIFLGDRISSGADSGLQILLMDETVFTIGPQSALEIDEFVYDPDSGAGKVSAEIIKGSFRFISGKVAKDKPSDMTVRVPNGTIGIRGTIVAGRVDPALSTVVLLGPGASNNAAERVGAISVENSGVAVEITRSGWGTTIGADGIPTPPAQLPPAAIDALTKSLKADDGKKKKDNDNGNGNSDGKKKGSQQASKSKDGGDKGGKKGKADKTDKSGGGTEKKASGSAGGPKGKTGPGRFGGDMNKMAGQTAAAAITFSDPGIRPPPPPPPPDPTDLLLSNRDGITTIAELISIPSGEFHFAGTAPFFLSAVNTGTYPGIITGKGKINSSFNIDFGSRTLGGGSSHIQIRDANDAIIDEALINPIQYDDNTGDFSTNLAAGTFITSDFVTAGANSTCPTCFAGSTGQIRNTSLGIATGSTLVVNFDNAGTTVGTGTVKGVRVGGLSLSPPP